MTKFDPTKVRGSGKWICEKRAGFGGRMGSSFSRHWWRWSARHAAQMYLTFNLFPGELDAQVFHESERTGA